VTYFIETASGTFECEVTPDTPGVCWRTLTVRQASGRPLTPEEWERGAEVIAAELHRLGREGTVRLGGEAHGDE
jgi:hypothetical protein